MEVALLAALLSTLFFTIQATPQTSSTDAPIAYREHPLVHELQEAKLRIARLESIFEERLQAINSISLYIGQKEKMIDDMTHEISRLQTALSSFKDDSSKAHERLNALEKEVRRLWDVSRRNNFEIHNLELKAQDAEERLEAITKRVENVAAIVSEQWIQFQHLEQAVQMAKERTLKVNRELSLATCPILKYTKSVFIHYLGKLKGALSPYITGKGSASNTYMSHALHLFMRAYTAAKDYHHQLQGVVRQGMERHDFTAVLASREVVFFVASALILFPVMGACVFLSSQFS